MINPPELFVREKTGEYRIATPSEVIETGRIKIEDQYRNISLQEIKKPMNAKNFFLHKLALLEREVFGVVFLSTRHTILHYEEMFKGTLNFSPVYPREIVKVALERNAAAIIVAHNHPSGNTVPSDADIEITKRIRTTLDLFDIHLLDHILVAGSKAISFREGLIGF